MHEAAGFLLRQALTGRPLPPAAQNVLDIWQDFFDGHVESDLEALGDTLEDQAVFAKQAWRIIEELGYGDQLGDDPDEMDPDELESDSEKDQDNDQSGDEGGEDDSESQE